MGDQVGQGHADHDQGGQRPEPGDAAHQDALPLPVLPMPVKCWKPQYRAMPSRTPGSVTRMLTSSPRQAPPDEHQRRDREAAAPDDREETRLVGAPAAG